MVEVSRPTITLLPPLQEEDDKEGDVLPRELRENFECMRRLLREEERQRRQITEEREEEGDKKRRRIVREEVNTSDSTEEEGQTPAEPSGLERTKFQLAVATVSLVDSEISRLTNGIAELEALLAASEPPDSFPQMSAHDLTTNDNEDENDSLSSGEMEQTAMGE